MDALERCQRGGDSERAGASEEEIRGVQCAEVACDVRSAANAIGDVRGERLRAQGNLRPLRPAHRVQRPQRRFDLFHVAYPPEAAL